MGQYLAESDNYKITSEDEEAYLEFKNDPNKEPVIIGSFYGNPNCAIIFEDENYVVVGGEGLVIYKIEEPFDYYHYGPRKSPQFKSFFNGKDCWWIKAIYQDSWNARNNSFTFLALNNEGYSLYTMNAATLEMEKMGTIPDLPQ